MVQLQQEVILHKVTCPHTFHQNGVVECRHRHIVERGMALLLTAYTPITLWPYAMQTITFLINILLIKFLFSLSLFDFYMVRLPRIMLYKSLAASVFLV